MLSKDTSGGSGESGVQENPGAGWQESREGVKEGRDERI